MILQCHHYLCRQYGYDGKMYPHIDTHAIMNLNLEWQTDIRVQSTRCFVSYLHISLSHWFVTNIIFLYDRHKIDDDVYKYMVDLFLTMSEVTIDCLIDNITLYIHHSIKNIKCENKWYTDISFPIWHVDIYNECVERVDLTPDCLVFRIRVVYASHLSRFYFWIIGRAYK
jgi:hypothetical protein